jgi:hypothetical protein
MSVAWLAKDMPEFYPPNAARDTEEYVALQQRRLEALFASHPEVATTEQVVALLKANKFCVNVNPYNPEDVSVYLASSIAPELDVYLYVASYWQDRQKGQQNQAAAPAPAPHTVAIESGEPTDSSWPGESWYIVLDGQRWFECALRSEAEEGAERLRRRLAI